jgi:N-acyl-L-homoserine lactone synthetase
LLRGYRFRLCDTAAAVARGLEVRRSVYRDDCGYDVPIPDAYDHRSWFLLAEHVASGEAVGSMRVTPRWAGPLEAEEYFTLPAHLRSPKVVEVTRFAILPPFRKSKRFLPVVAMGLFKLVCNFVKQIDAQYVVVCAKPERVWTYQWLKFERTGLSAAYVKLDGAAHELMVCDLGGGIAKYGDHRYWEFFFDIHHPEVIMPSRIPSFGIGDGVRPEVRNVRRFA